MTTLEVRLLGRFEVRRGTELVEITSRPAQSLLAYLILSAGTAHRRERLAALLWPDADDPAARRNLRHALWRIRHALETTPTLPHSASTTPYILADAITISFNAQADYWLDVAALEKANSQNCTPGQLIGAAVLYTGDLLPGFHDEWVIRERERLIVAYEQRIRWLLDCLIDEQQWDAVLEWAERWIALGHTPEPAFQALMQAHAGRGDRSAVAFAYQRCREALEREYGLEPTEETQALYEKLKRASDRPSQPINHIPRILEQRIKQQDRVAEPAEMRNIHAGASEGGDQSPSARPARALLYEPVQVAYPNNLPTQLTRFIGREREMTEVIALLNTSRLLTLTGSGGCGKTRLAQEVGACLVGTGLAPRMRMDPGLDKIKPVSSLSLPDGVWQVELAPVLNSALVPDAVVSALGIQDTGRPAQAALVDYLRNKQMLLILDNCEHLVQACAELATALLRACPYLHMLATSRESLNIPGEVTWRVPSLAPSEAVQLFTERARAAQPDFVFAPDSDTIQQICTRLDNMPLAIELAAARMRTFTAEQIASRLDDRFRLLMRGSRTALPRQQTLRAAIDWSYDLLSSAERALLRQLSVFAGGWTIEAVEGVWTGPDALTLLDQLANKSLVQLDTVVAQPRYTLLETVRQYALEKLIEAGEHEQAHKRHLEYFINLAQSAKPHRRGPEQVAWLDRLEAELDNFRAALDWCALTGDVQQAERLIDGLGWLWHQRGYCLEGRKWIETVLPADLTDATHARVTACLASGSLAARIGLPVARAEFEQALEVARQLHDAQLIVQADLGLAQLTPDDIQAAQLLEEAARLARESGLKREAFGALRLLGALAEKRGDQQQAYGLLAQALAGFRELGDTDLVAYVLGEQAQLAIEQGDYFNAEQVLVESVALARNLKSSIQIADVLIRLAIVYIYQGNIEGARDGVRECLATYQAVGNQERVGECLSVAAGIAHAQGNLRQAALLLAAAQGIWHALGTERWQALASGQFPEITAEYKRRLQVVRAALDTTDFDLAWSEGHKLTPQEAIQLALATTLAS